MLILLTLLFAAAVFIGVIALAAPTKKVSSFNTSETRTPSTTSNPVVNRLMNSDRVKAMADEDSEAKTLLSETGSKETVSEFYAWRFYNAFLVGGIIAGLFLFIALMVSVLVGATAGYITAAVAVGLGALIGWVIYAARGTGSLRGKTQKNAERVNRNAYQLLERVASGLESGLGPREAFLEAGPYITDPDVARQVNLTISDLNSNVPFAEAMKGLKNRCDLNGKRGVFPVIGSFADTMATAERDGTNPAPDFIKRANGLRKQKALVIKERSDKAVMLIGSVGLIGFSPLIVTAVLWGVVYGQLVERGILS